MAASSHEEITKKERLSPSDVNLLTGHGKEKTMLDLGKSIDKTNLASLRQEVGFFVVEKEYPSQKKRFVVFDVTKDSNDKDNQSDVAYIGDVISAFREQFPNEQGTLLLPMRQCRRFYLGPQRHHIVLAEVNLEKKRVEIHDSQTAKINGVYPDQFKDGLAKKLDLHYAPDKEGTFHCYASQDNQHACGFYVSAFVNDILEKGNTVGLKAIRCSIDNIRTSQKMVVDARQKDIDEHDKLGDMDEEASEEKASVLGDDDGELVSVRGLDKDYRSLGKNFEGNEPYQAQHIIILAELAHDYAKPPGAALHSPNTMLAALSLYLQLFLLTSSENSPAESAEKFGLSVEMIAKMHHEISTFVHLVAPDSKQKKEYATFANYILTIMELPLAERKADKKNINAVVFSLLNNSKMWDLYKKGLSDAVGLPSKHIEQEVSAYKGKAKERAEKTNPASASNTPARGSGGGA